MDHCQERSAAAVYWTQEAASTTVRYIKDLSLPEGWRVQSLQGSIYFFSPRGER